MTRIRFSDEWIEKVENWAARHAAMVKRYEALLRYQKMQSYALELTPDEMHQFYSCEGWKRNAMPPEAWLADAIDSDDWEEPISHQAVAESE